MVTTCGHSTGQSQGQLGDMWEEGGRGVSLENVARKPRFSRPASRLFLARACFHPWINTSGHQLDRPGENNRVVAQATFWSNKLERLQRELRRLWPGATMVPLQATSQRLYSPAFWHLSSATPHRPLFYLENPSLRVTPP
ncbi:hypothetical protein RRG08_044301 [Elysia crispata]|uniref:Uncharacterized protein n=1 Tax=Elysia crispata TaxID=231223 RepID=A0AAE1CPE6_9GAST|nr:hypothetical protein RRG08_044301 [Elysia crispata]